MSRAPLSDAIGRGYDFPRNVQFSVFLENRCGKLLELVEIFEDQPLKILGLSIIDAADHAVIRLLTSNSQLARTLLERAHFSFNEADVLVVEVTGDRTLPLLCTSLLSAEVNIHYTYPLLVCRIGGGSALALRTEDYILAGQILRRKLFNLLGEHDLQDPGTSPDVSMQ